MGDDEVVTARTARVSPALLNIQHVEVPEPQVVGEHVQLGQEGGPGLVDGGNLVETVEIYDGLLPEEDLEELHDGPQRVELHHPVRLTAELHHQPVVGQVGDVVAGLPDGHLYTGLNSAVLLKPSDLFRVNSQHKEDTYHKDIV